MTTAKSYEIMQQFIHCKVNKVKDIHIAKETEILLNVTSDIENEYRAVLEEGVIKYNTFNNITSITKEMEKDMNWGRLLALHTFIGMVAKIHKGNDVMIDKLINWLSCCSNTWVDANGGWKEFIKLYGRQQQQQHSTNYFFYLLIPPCIYVLGKYLVKCL